MSNGRSDAVVGRTRGFARPAIYWFGGLVLALLSGCAARPPVDRDVELEESRDMKKPFVISEAKLPAGYPPAGPVGEIIIKQYPAARIAMVRKEGTSPASANKMFRPLFDHIKKNEISMTSPVVMDYEPGSSDFSPVSMAFVYGDSSIGQTGKDGEVSVEDVPAITVVSIGVRGSYNDDNFKVGLNQLQGWLDQHKADYRPAGPPRYLGYNSPFVPWFLKYGEVQMPIKRTR